MAIRACLHLTEENRERCSMALLMHRLRFPECQDSFHPYSGGSTCLRGQGIAGMVFVLEETTMLQ